jgi:hypothetical protein
MGVWRTFVRWLVKKDAVIQKKPIPKAINEHAAKVIDPFVK